MIIEPLSDYLSGVLDRELPAATVEKTHHHIIDTIAAMVSGSRLPAGLAGRRYAEANSGREEALVLGTDIRTDATTAALANAMSAHADETDDSHAPSLTHPGCGVVPAALAIAERNGATGTDLVRAVAAGYDLAGRINPAFWPDYTVLRTKIHSTHAFGSLWGAAAAAAALGRCSPTEIRYLLSYTAQQTAGVKSWLRDVEHIEKAYAFAGLGASNGVRSLTFVEAGWPGVRDVFEGTPNLFDAFGDGAEPERLIEGLGERFVIDETNIKRFSVGSPAQAPLQGLVDLIRDEGLEPSAIQRVDVTMPGPMAEVVLGRQMPDINLPYLLACVLDDGDVTFASSHDESRFEAWQEKGHDDRIVIHKSETMEYIRQALVEVSLDDGRSFTRHETDVRGTAGNPMTRKEVEDKARDLFDGFISADQTQRLLDLCTDLSQLDDVRELRELLTIPQETNRG